MKKIAISLLCCISCLAVFAQPGKKTFPLENTTSLKPVQVTLNPETYEGKKCIKVMDTAKGITGETKYARLTDLVFHNGTIEVELAGKPAATAGQAARGFVGIAFRIDDTDTKFECIYLRPTNGRAEDQERRNHATQYISYPDYPWEKLRKEYPSKYESYVDLEVGKWTAIKIVVQDNTARLYVHGALQPSLIVSDLKHGATQKGSIGLWVGYGTEAHFRNLVVTRTID